MVLNGDGVPAASVLSRNLFKILILRPLLRLGEVETLRMGLNNLHFNKPSKLFCCMLKSENHSSRSLHVPGMCVVLRCQLKPDN